MIFFKNNTILYNTIAMDVYLERYLSNKDTIIIYKTKTLEAIYEDVWSNNGWRGGTRFGISRVTALNNF